MFYPRLKKKISIFITLLMLCVLCAWYTGMSRLYKHSPYIKYQVTTFFKEMDFLLTPSVNCHEEPPFLVILVTSAHDQQRTRMAIRETWGKERRIQNKKVVTYFLFGITNNHHHQLMLDTENEQYGDIIQKNFIDTYRNLTLKTLMGIEWVNLFCSSSSFVMKTDTDMFINPFYLVELLLKRGKETHFFTGYIKLNEAPIRYWLNKWYISEDEYPENIYPPFCSGTGYVFSTDLVSMIYNVSQSISTISLEDVYIGLCLAKLNIRPRPLSTEDVFFPDRISFSACVFHNVVTVHNVRSYELLKYWKVLEDSEECKN